MHFKWSVNTILIRKENYKANTENPGKHSYRVPRDCRSGLFIVTSVKIHEKSLNNQTR